ncbi:MAG: bifunctional glutamate N-acetyltransferase/amino-acid acetyltransferase ArgJ [Nitrospirae bacterium]|nr:MAG: bifunctional glutamate N-acetyltransferase/amino-acid acetyltransferase ArgJ [Nitrospirota bacterium]
MVKFSRGGVTAPSGFLAAGIHCGIKPSPLLDLAVIASEVAGPIAGVFTTNRFPAAPVIVDRLHLRHKTGRAVIINSGNANAFTGAQGLADAKEMAQLTADFLGCPHYQVYVGSTGVICPRLPMPCIREHLPRLMARLRKGGHREAATAILTTDTKVKEVAIVTKLQGTTITVGGMAKGAGMIHPNMATMLAFLTTDAMLHQPALQQALSQAVERSFHCISVDGETSTNDTVLCLANGSAGTAILDPRSPDMARFQQALNEACLALALQIVDDGEGATKRVEFRITGAQTTSEAKCIAKTLATSPLIKTALFGEDPNWGRIIAAVGRAGPRVRSEDFALAFDDVIVVHPGMKITPDAERRVRRIMQKKRFTIQVTVGRGSAAATIWTTDLSYDYVRINASYRS